MDWNRAIWLAETRHVAGPFEAVVTAKSKQIEIQNNALSDNKQLSDCLVVPFGKKSTSVVQNGPFKI